MNTLAILAFAMGQAQPTSIPYSGGTLKLERLASLEYPWGICSLPDGRVLVTEKPGRLRIFQNGQLSEPVSGVPKVVFHEQGGLLDVERDPGFSRNRFIYLYFVEPAEVQTQVVDNWDPRIGPKPERMDHTLKGGAVARAVLDGNALRDVRIIWRQSPKTIGRGHFGGRLTFDAAGRLYVTSGDRQRFTPAQDMNSTLGKVIRINRDGSIPAGNPYPGKATWSVGHRNPMGIAFNPSSGKLWIHEMGPLGGDEFNAINPRTNYGWPTVSNGDNYDRTRIPDHDTQLRFKKPAITWNPVISPSGLLFYTGNLFPKWRGSALLGGLSSMSLIRVSIKNGIPMEEERIGLFRRIRDVHQAPDGSLWLLVDAKQGGMLRMTPES